ncbi:MAG: thiol:disulfide interchange protein DsbA/DsbL [Limnobacter sp.]|nr:thiol:disulfide interchange protein DsbA/DsbL [Limnobacter sp.]
MNRRELFKLGSVLGLGSMLPITSVWAQGQPYREIDPPLPTSVPGKIEVIEFFWYGCGHCFNFEPRVQRWKKTLPEDVLFSQVPVGWNSRRVNFSGHQKLFYTLEAMGVLDTAHQKVFNAIHIGKLALANDAQIFDFAESIGLDREQFANTFKSFTVATKVAQASKMTEQYKIEGVPSLAIDGKFVTSEVMTAESATHSKAGPDGVFKVAELLIMRQRQAG